MKKIYVFYKSEERKASRELATVKDSIEAVALSKAIARRFRKDPDVRLDYQEGISEVVGQVVYDWMNLKRHEGWVTLNKLTDLDSGASVVLRMRWKGDDMAEGAF